MDAPENEINLSISTSASPPPLNDSDVVTVDFDMCSCGGNPHEVLDQKLETDCFRPSDVSSVSLPSRDKPPCTPVLSNRDSDAEARAGVRVCVEVDDGCWLRYWS